MKNRRRGFASYFCWCPLCCKCVHFAREPTFEPFAAHKRAHLRTQTSQIRPKRRQNIGLAVVGSKHCAWNRNCCQFQVSINNFRVNSTRPWSSSSRSSAAFCFFDSPPVCLALFWCARNIHSAYSARNSIHSAKGKEPLLENQLRWQIALISKNNRLHCLCFVRWMRGHWTHQFTN